jgi:muramoyltetrapeptide carboxypeptidase LdcA involved in peptidoglycan recycling
MLGPATRKTGSFFPMRATGRFRKVIPLVTIVGGTHLGLNLLQGSRYFPCLDDVVLFLEMPACGNATLMDLDNTLRMLSLQSRFDSVKGVVIGRYAREGHVTRRKLMDLVAEIPRMRHLPVMANVDFGHTAPSATIPLGGRCVLRVSQSDPSLVITSH